MKKITRTIFTAVTLLAAVLFLTKPVSYYAKPDIQSPETIPAEFAAQASDSLYEESYANSQGIFREESSAMSPLSPKSLYAVTDNLSANSLHALSAVLMDADTGRILYEKDGETARPNASTTKVLTCILALENASPDDIVTVSARAASQPDVQLNIREGEEYRLGDLLYSLMLKSHNDTAVAIAEHIGGSVEGFARMMNEKARTLGCENTHFVTPNGLDSADSAGIHRTTAHDLALLMRYAIKNRRFLEITQTRDYTFSDLAGKRTFTVQNTNALLDMMDGVLSGKTGFTGDAGYCYVCAREKDGKTFIVSLLGCGWPNNKTWKWQDTRALLDYGDANYDYRPVWQTPVSKPVLVKSGVENEPGEKICLRGKCVISSQERSRRILTGKDERIKCKVELPEEITAPVKKDSKIGEVVFFLGKEKIAAYPVLAEKSVEKISYRWYLKRVFHNYFHG